MMKKQTYFFWCFLVAAGLNACTNDGTNAADQTSQNDSLAKNQPANQLPKVMVTLAGNWRNVSDTLNRIIFNSSTLYRIQDGKIVAEEMIEIHENCPAECGVQDNANGCFTATVNGQKTCYRIVELSDEKLSYASSTDPAKVMTFLKIGK